MFKENSTVYFVFQGDFSDGRYNGFYCLPSTFVYFPFVPIRYISTRPNFSDYPETSISVVHVGSHRYWYMPTELLEKEFSFDKFLLAKLAWGGSVSQAQFKSIMATL